tara:strand:- start:917 stop:1183 length:267 start_codon:yes stop_codon:yes gene_type:complete
VRYRNGERAISSDQKTYQASLLYHKSQPRPLSTSSRLQTLLRLLKRPNGQKKKKPKGRRPKPNTTPIRIRSEVVGVVGEVALVEPEAR